jgi:hypothetical protein
MIDRFDTQDAAASHTTKTRPIADRFVMHSDVTVEIRDKNGVLKHRSEQKNLRVNGGADFWNSQLFTTGAAAAGATFIAITTDATAPAATDTTLTSEETTNGLGRAAATLAHTTAAASTTLSHTWTYTGSTSKVIAKLGLLTAISAGTLVLQTLLASTGTVNANGDTITCSWVVNY